ncbi:MAG: aldo/keto reductase [Clostridia bacterium]|nr:aldo/keto reductase [Clostridia bacterium]
MIMKSVTDTFTLSNGVNIPCLGYGTWQTPADVACNCVSYALQQGYRHIDTAAAYGNEFSVGEGIRASGVQREQIFLTTKHWITHRGYEKTIEACDDSLLALGVDYIDLYLIHWPAVAKIAENWEEINAETWRGFEKLYKDGKIRAIGVSNFLPSHLEALKKTAEIMPMVNQIEFHPGYTQNEVVDYCKANNILLEAWSPLGCGRLLANPVIDQIARWHDCSPAQLCIRYALEKGLLPLPKSVTPPRIVENMRVFGFSLRPEDIAAIDEMEETGFSGFYPEDAPADAL